MAQQMEVGGLVLQVPDTREELTQHMQMRSELGGGEPAPGGLEDFTRNALDLGPGGVLITAGSGDTDWGVFPGSMQTLDYTLALFKGLGYEADDPLVKWGLEARYARGPLLRKTGAALISVFDERALEPNEAINDEVLAGQLVATLEATKNPLVTVRLASAQVLAKLGATEVSLILPNGEATPPEEVSAYVAREGDKKVTRQPASPEWRDKMNGVLDESPSAAESRLTIAQTLLALEAGR